MDYENMSDFEINKRVAEAYGFLIQEIDDSNSLGMTSDFHEKYPSVVWVAHLDCSTGRQCEPWWQFDPCNNPSDAWPIITSNAIDIEFAVDSLGGIGQAHVYVEGDIDLECNFNDNSKALRAAMIVYLMMQEAKCSGNQ